MAFRHVDLCSGIGGFALGFERAELSRPILFCDIEPWSRKILAKHWPHVPIAEDVKELASDPDRNVPDCDILTAGYPCQPFSLAGERRGTEDDRHIWPYILSIVKAKRPSWCVFENVYGHVSMGLDEVLSDLEGEGYAARPFIVPACAADAPHRRDRIWIVARNVAHAKSLHSNGSGEHSQQGQRQEPKLGDSCSSDNVADTKSTGLEGRNIRRDQGPTIPRFGESGRTEQNLWLPEPAVGRVANGIPRRVDRLRGLGNAIVPQIAMQIGKTIKAVHDIPAQGYAHNNSNNQTT